MSVVTRCAFGDHYYKGMICDCRSRDNFGGLHGCVILPIEPTKEMIRAGAAMSCADMEQETDAIDIYKAMVEVGRK
jgi:hypothetical protein